MCSSDLGSGIDVTEYASVDVSVTPSLEAKSVTITPGIGYDGLSSVAITIDPISSTYVGSGITRRSSSDLTASGATVSVPSGYYETSASKSVASGSMGTPTATKGTVSNHSISITPSVTNTAGYIAGGTVNGTAVSVSASELVSGTYSVTSSGTKDVTNYASISVPSGTEGTPSATKSAVSNHSVTVTPSVTNTSGFISGTTKTGTAVTVTAAELVSGSETKTQNGTYDVTNLAELVVDVDTSPKYTATIGTLGAYRNYIYYNNVRYLEDSSFEFSAGDSCTIRVYGEYGGANIYENGTQIGTSDSGVTYTYVLPSCDIEIVTSDSGGAARVDITKSALITVEPLSVTTNGTYTAPSGKAYSPVTVNVSSGTPTLQAKTASPTTSQQTITADSGYDGLSQVTISAMPSGTAGTPTATKGAVSNHSISVTPSVTNTTGYITGSTKTGTAVTVTASELVSGSQTITQNGTVDVTNLASVTVALAFNTIYTGQTPPSASLGVDGDIYIQL